MGLLIAFCFLFISRSEVCLRHSCDFRCCLFTTVLQPLERLSRQRPPARLFCAEMVFTVAAQFAVHLFSLSCCFYEAKKLDATYSATSCLRVADCLFSEVDLEADFEPSVVNSSVFLMSTWMQVVTFVVNYQVFSICVPTCTPFFTRSCRGIHL